MITPEEIDLRNLLCMDITLHRTLKRNRITDILKLGNCKVDDLQCLGIPRDKAIEILFDVHDYLGQRGRYFKLHRLV